MIAATHSADPGVLIPLLAVVIPAWFFFLVWLLATLSGWRRLARRYPLNRPVEAIRTMRWQSARVGWVNYNNCLTVEISMEGIGLKILPPFNLFSPPLLLPWSELSEPVTRKFLGRETVHFEVGQPPVGSITLPKKIFSEVPEIPMKTRP